MADNTSRITYILEAAAARAGAKALSNDLDGIGKSAKSGAATATAALNTTAAASQGVASSSASAGRGLTVLEGAAISADPRIASLFASLSSMKGELNAMAPVAEKGAASLTSTATASTAAAASFGGLTAGFALAIPLIINLAGVLFELLNAKKAQIKLDLDQIEVDIQRHQSMQTGTLFTREYATVLHDMNAINSEVDRTTKELLVARAEEADAVRKSTTVYKDYAANTDNLVDKTAAYVVGLFSRVKSENEATAATQAAGTAQREKAEIQIRANAISGKTIEQLITERREAGATANELGLLASAWGQAVFARSRYEAGRGVISTLRLEIAQAAAERGEILKGTEARRLQAEGIAKLPPEQRKLAEQSQLTEKSLRAFDETQAKAARGSGAAAAAARSYANTLVDLRKRAADAEAALSLDTLSLQQFRITTQIQREREHLEINKKDKVAALRFLDQIERDSLAGTLRAAADANKQAQERTRADRLKHLKEIERMETEHNKVLLQQYMNRLQQQDRLDRIDAAAKVSGSDFKADKSRDELARGSEIELRFARGAGSLESVLPDMEKVQQAIGLLDELGLTIGEVDAMYGSTSNSVDQLITRMELLSGANISAIDSFAQMIDLQAVMVSGIHAFTNAISGAIAGTENLGRALLIGFLTIISEIAITLGTLFTLAAAGFLFIPGLNWSSGALFAAGAAMLAFGAVLGGVAMKLGQDNTTASAGGGAGAGSSGGAAGPTGSTDPINNIIPFPTSGTGPMTITVINRFDKGGLKAVMKGEDFVTNQDILDTGSKTAKAIKKAS